MKKSELRKIIRSIIAEQIGPNTAPVGQTMSPGSGGVEIDATPTAQSTGQAGGSDPSVVQDVIGALEAAAVDIESSYPELARNVRGTVNKLKRFPTLTPEVMDLIKMIIAIANGDYNPIPSINEQNKHGGKGHSAKKTPGLLLGPFVNSWWLKALMAAIS